MNTDKGYLPNLVLLLPVVLSFWLLGAHYLRFGNMTVFLLLLVSPSILLLRRLLIVRFVQFCLGVIAVTWMQITYQMLEMRLMMGDDWMRMALIMGGVIIFTLLSACCFLHPKLERYYSANQ
ncbi:hypothetical protein C942_00075 [Photobacterium marinum]|uniref:Transmembrane protein n=1 Tax=Photobacterium marinum TaxID=1056511 RepID=L8JHT2_9GAMM|nr:hypothetical protein [Photobacterium marinum]ELR67768.1 hypothetical protein C942_00075 [Photobacterium marinum]